MEIKSQPALVQASSSEILTFLGNANNLFHLLPQDKISDWQANDDQCSFKVQGGFIITLIENGTNETDQLYLKAGEKSPFPFDLTIYLSPMEDKTEGYIHFKGEVNLFLKMMVEKPLTALFDYMSNRLQEHFA